MTLYLRTVTLVFVCILYSAHASAGMEKEGYSSRAGLFFTFLGGGSIGFETLEHAMSLLKHCESGKFIFRFQDQRKFKCRATLWKNQVTDQPGSFGTIEVLGVPKDPNDSMKFDLFSTRPTRKTKWQVRSLSEEELAALKTYVSSDKRYAHLQKQLALGKAIVVSKAGAAQVTTIVPGSWVRSEHYEAQRHHVFVGSMDNYRYQGQIPDKPDRYYDIDGDSFPEIQTDEICDGWCIKLWDIRASPNEIGRFGGH